MREYAACARVRRALFVRPSIAGTRTYTVYVYTMHGMYLYPCAAGYTDERIADAGPPHTLAHVPRPCARVCVCDWAPAHPCRHMRVLSADVDCVRLGSQAFYVASAFNANIGAWNTARVSDLSSVCAALRPAACHRGGRARPVFDAARPLCAAAPPMRSCTHVWALAWAGVHMCMNGVRRKDSIYVCKYIYI
jgi:hypothetical protein